jgi:hypothetical protein
MMASVKANRSARALHPCLLFLRPRDAAEQSADLVRALLQRRCVLLERLLLG